MYLDPGKILKDREKNSTTLSQQIASLKGTKPNIGQTYNRAADTSILASGQRSDRNRANYMAQGGGRMGAAGQLLAGESAANDMMGAQSQAAGLRAQGAEAQFGAEMSIQQLLAQLLAQQDAHKLQQEQLLAARQARIQSAPLRDPLGRLYTAGGQPAAYAGGPYMGRQDAGSYQTVPYFGSNQGPLGGNPYR